MAKAKAVTAKKAVKKAPKKDDRITVKVNQIGNGEKKLTLASGSKVADALVAAEFPSEGMQLRVNDTPATKVKKLADGDHVTVAPKVKGG